MHTPSIYYLICILLICLLKDSYEDDNFDIKFVTNAESVGWIYYQLDLKVSDLPRLTDKGINMAKKYIKSRVKKGIEDMFKVPKEEGACSSEEKLIHAKESALVNMQRDPNNKGFSRETVYMYLSHYVDIPADSLGGACNDNDEGPYYANWITNDDRDAYESFIRVINGVKAVEEFMNLLDIAKDMKGKLEDYQNEIIENGFSKFVRNKIEKFLKDNLRDFGSNLIDGKSPGEYFEEKFNEIAEHFNFIDEDTPEDEIISKINEKLGKDFVDSESLDAVKDAFAVAFETAIGSVTPITAAITIAKLPLLFLTTLAPKAAVAGMLYNLSGRLAGRVERVIFEDDDW